MIRVRYRQLTPLVLLAVGGLCRAATDQPMTAYWNTPIPSQSPAPPAPETCGACHSDKYSDWQGSRHAHAVSPGLIGQIIDYDEADAADCLNCHAPLEEQQLQFLMTDFETPVSGTGAQQPDPLTRHGVFCAVCHLRDGVLHAPSITSPGTETRAHQDVKTESFMRDSRFCSSCHQFDMTTAVNGKPLQDTYREWLASPYPAQGITCQRCHMPDGKHLFRGIHDPDTVKQGLTITTQVTDSSVDLVVQSTGIGHRFPTYSVARVRLTARSFDSSGRPVSGFDRERVLQRRISMEDGRWTELSDTRLEPGEYVTLSMPRQHGGVCPDTTAFRVIVEPAWYYHEQVYPSVIDELEAGPARDLLVLAKSQSEARRYVLYEKVVANDCDN